MNVQELITELSKYPADYDVILVDENRDFLVKVKGTEEFVHFQTAKSLGGVIIYGHEAV